MKIRTVAPLLLVLVAASSARAQESIAVARDLYTAASYDEALTMLSRLDTPSSQPSEKLTINQYRAFCLLALGRTTEAERAIEAVVSADPLYRPTDADASPRLRAAFATVRQRILPAVVQVEYEKAKAVFDQQDFKAAAREFDRVLQTLDDPDLVGAARRSPLAEIRTLAAGFKDLSAKAAEPPPAPPAPAPMAVASPSPAVDVKKIFNGVERGVIPPMIIRQVLPPFPRDMQAMPARVGLLEVIINEFGEVESASIVSTINARYDRLLLSATKGWKYRPAMLGTAPVRYRKLINVALKPGE